MSCPFFDVDVQRVESREIGRSKVTEVRVPFCNHKHSPVSERMARQVIGAAGLLRCGGDLGKCQVPADKLADC